MTIVKEYTPGACRGPLTRRGFLEIGSFALGGLALSDLLRLQAAAKAAGQKGNDNSVIVVWLQGGPSQFETYDPKPDAPVEIRGEFGPTATAVPGMQICELLPKHAKIADRYTLIRSIAHQYNDHGRGTWRMGKSFPRRKARISVPNRRHQYTEMEKL